MEVVKLIIVIVICTFFSGVAQREIYKSKYKNNIILYLIVLFITIGCGFIIYQLPYSILPYRNYNDDEHKNH